MYKIKTEKQGYGKIGEVLRSLIRIAGLNERQLCQILNIAPSTMHQLVNQPDINPRIDTLLPIAEYFNVSLEQLIGKTPLKDNDNIENIISQAQDTKLNEEWDAELFLECANMTCKLLKKYNHNMNYKQIIDMIRDFYLFCLNKNEKKVDKGVIKILIEDAIDL
ncbi:MAG: helix-turn-helix domain-containing protein [Candidatus Lariskella arthropodorum]